MAPLNDLILYNARLATMEPSTEGASALAMRDGRIEMVGSDADILSLSPGSTRRLDMEGATILPGFNDAHVHLWKVGWLLTGMHDARGARSIPELLEGLRAHASRQPPEGWVLARGYHEGRLDERRHPTREELDSVGGGRPVWLLRTCAHIAVANSRALELGGITPATASPPGGYIERDMTGAPTGLLHEAAQGLVARVIPPPTSEQYEAMILAGARHLLSLGITSATDPGVAPDVVEAYASIDRQRRMPLRMNLLAVRKSEHGDRQYPLPAKILTARLRLDSVKFFADGGLSGATAALRVSYRHKPMSGFLRLREEEFYDLGLEAREAGFRIGTHAIGDAAIDQVLSVYRRLAREIPGPTNRIEHFGLPDARQLAQAARLGVIAVTQPAFLAELGESFRLNLPPAYHERIYPIRSMLLAGVPVALSTDGPVVSDLNPLTGVRCAISRLDASGRPFGGGEGLSLHQALYAYTMGGAMASGDAANRGSISPGKWADLVVYERDPRRVPLDDLPAMRPRMTFVGGRVAHESGGGPG